MTNPPTKPGCCEQNLKDLFAEYDSACKERRAIEKYKSSFQPPGDYYDLPRNKIVKNRDRLKALCLLIGDLRNDIFDKARELVEAQHD